MPVPIPPTGEHTFAIEAQNMVELNRLLTTKASAPSLFLNVAGTGVRFSEVTVLDILALPAVQGMTVISIRLSYGSASVAPLPSNLQQQNNAQQNQTIYQKIQADSAGRQMERWNIMMQTQTQIFQITQDITANKANTADRSFQAMDGYIRN